MHDGKIAHVAIDRAFVDDDGVRWLVDFKPGAAAADDAEKFLTSVLQRERPTLERYLAFASSLGPQPARAACYFPQLGALRAL